MNKFLSWAVCLSMFLLLFSYCRPTGEDLIIHVPAEFRIGIREALGPAPRAVEIIIDPIEPPRCNNSPLIYEWETTSEGGHLRLQGFHQPIPCLPLTTLERYPLQTPWRQTGSYNFNGTLRDIITVPGLIERFSDKIRLQLFGSSGFLVDQPETLQLPEDILWGQFSYVYDSIRHDVLSDFLTQWQPGYQVYAHGNYGYFYLKKNNSALILQGNLHRLEFILGKVEADSFLSALNGLIASHPELSDVKVWTPQGELFP